MTYCLALRDFKGQAQFCNRHFNGINGKQVFKWKLFQNEFLIAFDLYICHPIKNYIGRVYFSTLIQFPVQIHLQCTFKALCYLNRDLKNQSFLKIIWNYLPPFWVHNLMWVEYCKVKVQPMWEMGRQHRQLIKKNPTLIAIANTHLQFCRVPINNIT